MEATSTEAESRLISLRTGQHVIRMWGFSLMQACGAGRKGEPSQRVHERSARVRWNGSLSGVHALSAFVDRDESKAAL
jgi:hypothetical protein